VLQKSGVHLRAASGWVVCVSPRHDVGPLVFLHQIFNSVNGAVPDAVGFVLARCCCSECCKAISVGDVESTKDLGGLFDGRAASNVSTVRYRHRKNDQRYRPHQLRHYDESSRLARQPWRGL
jgi:hypothetical protein